MPHTGVLQYLFCRCSWQDLNKLKSIIVMVPIEIRGYAFVTQPINNHGVMLLSKLARDFYHLMCRLQAFGLSATVADSGTIFRAVHFSDRM